MIGGNFVMIIFGAIGFGGLMGCVGMFVHVSLSCNEIGE